ncbi:lipid-A-disaccharide synthase, partial [Candidatus Omnitrophota bacterium]
KHKNIPVMYYISPQLWAWHKSRVNLIRKYIDRMVVLFDFEREFYRKYGVAADFVGHPLLDVVKPSENRDTFRKSLGANDKKLIGLLPGSRPQEIDRVFPAMVQSIETLQASIGPVVVVASCAPELDETLLKQHTHGTDIQVLRGKTYDIMAYCDALAVTSGTATLEAGISGTPMVVVYKTSLLTYLIGRAVVNVPDIGLINIVAGRRVVPELGQNEATPENIAAVLHKFCTNPELYADVKDALSHAKSKLGEPGASERAAAIAVEMLG